MASLHTVVHTVRTRQSSSRSCLYDLFSLGVYILERNSEKLLHEAILEKNGSNDDDDKIVARLTPRVSSLVAWSGKHSRHSRHPLSVPPTTTSGDVHSTTLLTFLIVVLPGQPLRRKISARVESKRDIVSRRNSNSNPRDGESIAVNILDLALSFPVVNPRDKVIAPPRTGYYNESDRRQVSIKVLERTLSNSETSLRYKIFFYLFETCTWKNRIDDFNRVLLHERSRCFLIISNTYV